MNIPANLKYTKTDEWFDPTTGKAGLTDYAQSQLSDIVFVEIIVVVGDDLQAGKPIASVESVKAAAETYAPVAAKVVAINEELANNPEVLNSDPYGQGWMIKVESTEAVGLMDSATYTKFCEERAH
ncbi:MAG: glycine cleavage system protein GcvH [Anaerolineales bacterium]|jgi:glycine cleavage system H protein